MFKLFKGFVTKDTSSPAAPERALAPRGNPQGTPLRSEVTDQRSSVVPRTASGPPRKPRAVTPRAHAVPRDLQSSTDIERYSRSHIPLWIFRKALPLRFAAMAESADEFVFN